MAAGWGSVRMVCLCALLQFRCVFSIGCQSESAASTCHPISNHSCITDHPPRQEQNLCQDVYEYSGPSSVLPSYVESCPRNQEGGSFDRCSAFAPYNHDANFFKITSVWSAVTSLDPQHFALDVSWYYRDAENAIAVTPSNSSLRGYEVRVKQSSRIVECWCLWEPRIFNITLGLDLTLQYRSSSLMDIEVLTLPFSNKFDETYYARNNETVWPSSCNNETVVHSSASSCTPPPYPDPRNVQAESRIASDFTKTLRVSWSHPSVTSHPLLYYVYCTSERDNVTVLANGTLSVSITGLDLNQTYSVQVQAYFPCSGTSSYISSGFRGEIGCGMLSDVAGVSVLSTTASTIPTSATSLPSDLTTEQLDSTSLLASVLLTVFLVLLILSLVLTVFLVVKYRRYCQRYCLAKSPFTGVDDLYEIEEGLLGKPVQLDVLVLYSMNTPRSEQEDIERFIVSRLKQRFQVNSCNDHTEKTIMEWVEERTRNARSVLIVCNKSFYKDWSGQSRSPLLNSLETLITSSVANGKFSKYATVVFGKSSKQFIPENQYLQAMPSFAVGTETVDDDIYGFIKINCQRKKF